MAMHDPISIYHSVPVEHIRKSLILVQKRIAAAERRHGRLPGSVRLVAAGKGQSPERLAQAAASGLRDLGENYVQEALAKLDSLEGADLTWHFIGRLQANKTRPVAERFAWLHALDHARIASRLHRQRPAGLAPLNVCIQVNLDAEPAKVGVVPDDIPELARRILELPRLRLRGLMALPRPRQGHAQQRKSFRRLRELLERLHEETDCKPDTLSMGTTVDLEAAVAEGATIVRVGTGLFGPRLG